MLNERENMALLTLLFFFSALLTCLCVALVINFIIELASIIDRSPTGQDALWAGIGIVLFTIYAFAFMAFGIFSSCGMLFNSSTKIAPAPTSVEGEQQSAVV
ncbi:hypothetical protein RIF29_14156 [Crotalaria pallida]|uniref:Uncharacterized protein n=1 Tax=Crotalaria pallida TaxID=3830 RepID=A0AAN9FCW8_CROPI